MIEKYTFWGVIRFLPRLIEELSIPPATFVSQMNYASRTGEEYNGMAAGAEAEK